MASLSTPHVRTTGRGPTPTESSRSSASGAGWRCASDGAWRFLLPETSPGRLSWFNPKLLWRSRNELLARISDPVPELRARWVEDRSDEQLCLNLESDLAEFSFLLMGDTGEGDKSQYVLVPPLLSHAKDAAFLVICSDVLYPLGDVNEYAGKFYFPYRTLPIPIYTLPGNHDWYDSLSGFMYFFCDRSPLPARAKGHSLQPDPPYATGPWIGRGFAAVRAGVRKLLWRRPPQVIDPAGLQLAKMARGAASQQQPVKQPGPYYVIDTKYVRLVCIDTGIKGNVDSQQGQWLLRMSRDPRPKILLTGKPLLVDGKTKECAVSGVRDTHDTVAKIAHDPAFNYVAVIGGDIHNYQHYPVSVGHRIVHHVVSGAGGAFMHATHTIAPVDSQNTYGATEDQFKCYPLRSDSMAAFSRVLQNSITRRGFGFKVELTDEEASAYLGTLPGMPKATRPLSPNMKTKPLSASVRRRGWLIRSLGCGKLFHKFFSPFLDWDEPPFYKSFLRLDVNADGATVRCFGVTGCGDVELNPPAEDTFDLQFPPATSRES